MCKILAVLTMLPFLVMAAEWQSLNGPPTGLAEDMSMGLYQSQWVTYSADAIYKLYRSVNEGEYWDSIYSDQRIVNPRCVITEPTNAQVVYAGIEDPITSQPPYNGNFQEH